MPPGDPTNPTPPAPDPNITQSAAEAYNNLAQAAGNSATSIEASNAVGQKANSTLGKLGQIAGTAAAGLFGVSNAVGQFTSGLDSTRLGGFTVQLEAIAEAATKQGTGLDVLKKAGSGLIDILKKVGGSGGQTTSIISRLSEAIASGSKDIGSIVAVAADYAKSFVQAADATTHASRATLAYAAANGSLKDVLSFVGNDMSRLNEIGIKQQKIWRDTEKQLGLVPGTVGKMAQAFNQIPGVTAEMVKNIESSNRPSEVFVNTLKLQMISGREYSAIMKDMNDGIKGFGLSQENAVKYTTRMSTAAEALKIPFQDFHEAITSSSAAFKMFTTNGESGYQMTKNLQSSMAGYIQMLKNAHIPMGNATEMAKNFAGAVGQMSIAQKAFISGQTGGPGGLMGAFQLDKLMDEGKIDQVFDKVQGVLRKQFGRVVTTAQAAQSQSAAEQMTRQIMILRQGPLGQFAKTDAEARRLLDAMANPAADAKATMKQMTEETKDETGLKKFLAQGNMLAEGSLGALNDILVAIQSGQMASSEKASRVVQPTLGARTFFRRSPGEVGGTTPGVMDERRRQAAAAAQGGTDRGATLVTQAMSDIKNLPNSIKGAMVSLANAFKTGNQNTVEAANAKLNTQIEMYRKLGSAGPASQQKETAQNIEAVKKAAASGIQSFMSRTPTSSSVLSQSLPPGTTTEDLKRGPLGHFVKSDTDAKKLLEPGAVENAAATGGATRPTSGRILDIRKSADYAPAGQRLPPPVAPAAQTGATKTTTSGPMGGQPGQAVPVTLAPGTAITVNFTGVCPHCKSHVSANEVGKTPNTAATVPRH